MHRPGPVALLSLPWLMRVLVAISILAFLALLWAFVAIFRHIGRTRRRRRRALESSRNDLAPTPDRAIIAPPPPPVGVPEITFTDPEAPLPEVSFTDPRAPIHEPASPAFQPYVRPVETRQPASSATPIVIHNHKTEVALADEFVDTLPPPPPPSTAAIPPATRESTFSPIPAWPHFGFTPSRQAQPLRVPITAPAEPEQALAAEQAIEDHQISGRSPISPPEPIPYAGPSLTDSSASVNPARLPMLIHPPPPAVKPVYPSAYPAPPPEPVLEAEQPPRPPLPMRSGQHPTARADWAYFNKDMGDLSDPSPAGSRTKIRAAKSE